MLMLILQRAIFKPILNIHRWKFIQYISREESQILNAKKKIQNPLPFVACLGGRGGGGWHLIEETLATLATQRHAAIHTLN